jgi:pimeloyl-ACP methyl ester carboxylesterase
MSAPWVWFTLRKVTLPTLGVVGQSSDVVSPAMLKHWQASQPQLSLHRVTGGHLFPMEHPDLVSPLILDFIHSGS